MSTRITLVLGLGLLCLLSIPFRSSNALWASSAKTLQPSTHNLKIEEFPKAYQGREPLKITALALGLTPIESGKDFQAGADWLKDLRITVKNVYPQAIRTVVLNVEFLPDDQEASRPTVTIYYGRNYIEFTKPLDPINEVSIKAQETATFHINSNYANFYDGVAERFKGQTLPANVRIFVSQVVFDDVNTGWYLGRYTARTSEGWVADPKVGRLSSSDFKMIKASLSTSATRFGNCWMWPGGPAQEQTLCDSASCPTCKYTNPRMQVEHVGWLRIKKTLNCHDQFFQNCGTCTQPDVWHLDFDHSCPS